MDIQSIIPIDYYELIIVFSNGEIKIFSPEKLQLYDRYNFLAYPNKLKAFRFSAREITWFNGLSFESNFMYDHTFEISAESLSKKSLTISVKNQAPTDQHASHHVYYFSIYPFKSEKQFVLGESIGGGHAEMGGCAFYSLSDLIETPDYVKHLELAGCSWAIEILKSNSNNPKIALQHLILEVCRQANPQ